MALLSRVGLFHFRTRPLRRVFSLDHLQPCTTNSLPQSHLARLERAFLCPFARAGMPSH
jgi:hypothetical protein